MEKEVQKNLNNIEKLADSIINHNIPQHRDLVELNSELDSFLDKIIHQKKYFKRL